MYGEILDKLELIMLMEDMYEGVKSDRVKIAKAVRTDEFMSYYKENNQKQMESMSWLFLKEFNQFDLNNQTELAMFYFSYKFFKKQSWFADKYLPSQNVTDFLSNTKKYKIINNSISVGIYDNLCELAASLAEGKNDFNIIDDWTDKLYSANVALGGEKVKTKEELKNDLTHLYKQRLQKDD